MALTSGNHRVGGREGEEQWEGEGEWDGGRPDRRSMLSF